MTNSIDFNKVIAYSKANCVISSLHYCAMYVKRAFIQGGCEYVSGDGWNNQKWCKANGFECIGDFVPKDKNPRPHNGMSIQFPPGYVQQTGDICLIKHGKIGHICYAMGSNINSWVSDYFQRPPSQKDGTGPYCYDDSNYTRVQFWRHKSVLNNAPVIADTGVEVGSSGDFTQSKNTSTNAPINIPGISNNVSRLASASKPKENILVQGDTRKNEFESLRNLMTGNAPDMGRKIIITTELYDSNILKGAQESRKEKV